MDELKAAIKIQKCFRHFINGRQKRFEMRYNCKNVWKLKSFAVRCALDENTFLYSKSYRQYLTNVYNSLNVWLHKDSDDVCDYSLSKQQYEIFETLQKKEHISFFVIKILLKSLTLDQLQFIQ